MVNTLHDSSSLVHSPFRVNRNGGRNNFMSDFSDTRNTVTVPTKHVFSIFPRVGPENHSLTSDPETASVSKSSRPQINFDAISLRACARICELAREKIRKQLKNAKRSEYVSCS